MDKIKLLQSRRKDVLSAGKKIREKIVELIDADSFVELSAYSFSKNEFYGEAEGEGVVTGFATIDGYPFYIIAQNFEVLSGGVSYSNCQKIVQCLDKAEKSSTPVIYILNSHGVQIGEGVTALEGMANVLLKASKLKGIIPQFSIVSGDVFGQVSLLTGLCDFNFMLNDGVLTANSPLVISAKSGKNLPKEKIGGADAIKNTNLCSFQAENIAFVKNTIAKLIDTIPVFGAETLDGEQDLNELCSNLSANSSASDLISCVFDKESVIEIGKDYSEEIKCVLARIGGIAVASVVFDGDVELNENNMEKLNAFCEFASYYSLPYITFTSVAGIKADISVNNSLVIKQISEYIQNFDSLENAKIAVVYKKAIGLGYTLFASKNIGFDYNFAFADSKIALFDDVQGAEIEFNEEKAENKAKLASKYADENADPINSAKGGFVDNIIDPAQIKQYLIASLQMLLR